MGVSGPFPTGSSSAPAVMSRMFDLLEVPEDMDIPEIGTGAGRNTALLVGDSIPENGRSSDC
nr:hypothetical protein [Candidatus Protofrankia californiensis]